MTANMSVNPRRFMRFDAKQANITGSICDRNDAVLRNIRLGGASFLLERPIDTNSSCNIEIKDGENKFHVSGRVAWARKPGEMKEIPENTEGMYAIGVVFLNTYHSASGSNLVELIDKLDT